MIVTSAADVRLSTGGFNHMSCAKTCSHGLAILALVLGGDPPSHLRTMACARDVNDKREEGRPLRKEYSIWMMCISKGRKGMTLSVELKPATKEIMLLYDRP